jgi:pimeloyl-ACP methyl ester carboxylesterase/AraC-like DNA-binding protein
MPEQLASLAQRRPFAIDDRAVERALDLIHARYREPLTVDQLAREAGVSRSVLGERFVSALGVPPMRYAGRWRLEVARHMLSEGRCGIAEIAWQVGFSSEAAFNRAFKRDCGIPPAEWRRQNRNAARPPGLPRQDIHTTRAADGTRLAWAEAGTGFPLLKTANWLNHLEFDWTSPLWRHWLVEFTRENRLIRYDERGNGLSDWDTPNLTFDAFVDDMESVVEAAGVEQFDVLAISQGAAVAAAYAVRHPGRIRRMILIGGYALGWKDRLTGDELARREAMVTLSRTGWGADNPAFRQMFTSLYIPGGNAEQADWFNELQRISTSPRNAERLQRALSAIDVRDLLPKVRTPTLVAHATGDEVIPFDCGEYLAAKIPDATFVPLDSNNHILLEDDRGWAQFRDAARAFLRA